MAAPLAQQLPSATLRYEDCLVSVTSAERSDLDWLAAFLACGFERAPVGAAQRRVALNVDAAAYDRLLACGAPGSGAPVEGFARDAEPSLLERWPASGPASVFRDPRKAVFYRVTDGGASVEILARERGPRCRTTLMRVVRELTMDRVVASGGILVHGAAIGVGGGVVVICGPKRSGKTTLLMAMLERAGVRYVANDRCVLRLTPAGASVRGLPTLVSVRRDTLARFPAARARLGSVRPDLAGAEQAQRPSFSMSPPEFCELMGDCPRASGGPLLALLFPRIGEDAAPLSWRRLGAEEALARLRAGLFRAGHASPLGQAFVSAAAAAADARDADHRLVAERIPGFACSLGGDAAPGEQDCRRLLESVT
jgi:hypothetical protein